MGRVLHRLYSLSVMMMRVDAAYEAYHAATLRVVATGKTPDEIVGEVNAQVERVENNDFTRGAGHLTAMLALLYVAVEAWRKWKFFDERVDELLADPRVDKLKKYRHAVFHAELVGHEDVLTFNQAETTAPWAGHLQNELRRALRDWHANLPERMDEYLRRSPL